MNLSGETSVTSAEIMAASEADNEDIAEAFCKLSEADEYSNWTLNGEFFQTCKFLLRLVPPNQKHDAMCRFSIFLFHSVQCYCTYC